MRDRRQTISVLLSGVRVELQQRLLPTGVIAGTGISVDRAGSTVTINSLTSSDGVVTGGTFLSDILTLTRSTPLAPIIISGFGTAAPWALASSPSGTAPPERLGTGVPSSTLFLRGDGAWATPAGGGMADGVVTSGTFDPANSEIDFVVASPGANFSVGLPIGGGSFLSLSDTPNAFAASQCLAADGAGTALQFQACVTGGGADGVIESIGFTGRSVAIGRSIGADVSGTLPAGAFDDRIEPWAHAVNPTGLVPPSRLGTGT